MRWGHVHFFSTHRLTNLILPSLTDLPTLPIFLFSPFLPTLHFLRPQKKKVQINMIRSKKNKKRGMVVSRHDRRVILMDTK